MNTFWVHKNWKWKKENATAKYIDEHCEEAVTLTDAQATVEALQRERKQAEQKHLQDVAYMRSQYDSIVAMKDEVQAALDAEREKVKGLAQQVQDQSTANLETMRHTDDMQSRALDAERALAHLQALVRALVGTKSFTINGYACSSQTSAERLGALPGPYAHLPREEYQALRDERDRLREALEQIAKWDKRSQSETVQQFAKAALTPAGGGQDGQL